MEPQTSAEVLQDAHRNGSPGLLSELWLMVRTTGKWWLVPVLIVLLILGVMVGLSATCYAPFIYTLF